MHAASVQSHMIRPFGHHSVLTASHSTDGITQVCQSVVEILVMCELNVSEGAFSALAQCVEEVRALVPVSSEGGVAVSNGCLSVCEGAEDGFH